MGASCVPSMGATTGVFNSAELAEFVLSNQLEIEALEEGRSCGFQPQK